MSRLDEAELIAAMCQRVGVPESPEGPGDDAALFDGHVVSVDLMVEGVHFTRAHPPRWLGEKLLAVNLSDIGAMGALPSRCVLSAAIPEDMPRDWWCELSEGLGQLAQSAGVLLVGGDVTRSPGPLMLGITLFGEVTGSRALLRRGATAGDLVMLHCPQGVGRSSHGLELWLKMGLEGWSVGVIEDPDPCLEAHLRPKTSWDVGPWALEMGASAGMDCSDGLFADLPRLAVQSGVGLHIELGGLPRDRACGDMGLRARAAGGEDYGLIVTVNSDDEALFLSKGFITLGHVRHGEGVAWFVDGVRLHQASPSFEHFSSS